MARLRFGDDVNEQLEDLANQLERASQVLRDVVKGKRMERADKHLERSEERDHDGER